MKYIEKNGSYEINLLVYMGYSILFLSIIFVTHRVQYDLVHTFQHIQKVLIEGSIS